MEASTAVVIPLFRPRTCWECEHHRDLTDPVGTSSFCGLFDEAIHYEGQADECDGYEFHAEG